MKWDAEKAIAVLVIAVLLIVVADQIVIPALLEVPPPIEIFRMYVRAN